MKKGCFIIVIIIVLVPILLLYVPQTVNDICCLQFKNEVEADVEATEGVENIKTVYKCGNTSGTGDHTELWVAVMIKTELTYDALCEKISCNSITRIEEVDKYSFPHFADEELFSMLLEHSTAKKENEQYYIFQFTKPAPLSWLDIRGM